MDYSKPPPLSKQPKIARYTISESDKRLFPGPSTSYPHKAPRMTMDAAIRKPVLTSPLPPSSQRHQPSSQQSQQSQAAQLYQQQTSQQSRLSQHNDNTQSQTRRVTLGRKLPEAFVTSPQVKLFNSGGVIPQSTTTKIRDTRDYRSVEFQRHAVRIIIEYLNKYQYDGTVTQKTLRGLGVKDFEHIFKFLFLQLTYSYDFGPKFEDEFIDLLRIIRYPYIDSISPKSLYSIAAPHSLPRYLALLSWMVDLCMTVDRRRHTLHQRIGPEGTIIDPAKGLSNAQMDLLFFDYSVAKYNAFMQGKNGQDADDELKVVFSVIKKGNIDRYNNIMAEKQSIFQESRALDEQKQIYEQAQQKIKNLEERIATHNTNIAALQVKVEKYTIANQRMEHTLKTFVSNHKKLQTDKEEIRASIKNPEVTDEEIKKLYKQRSDLDMENDNRRQILDQLRIATWELETQIQEKRNEIKRIVMDYNNLTKTIDHRRLNDADIDPTPLTEPLVFNSDTSDLDDMVTPQLGKTTLPVLQQYVETLKQSVSDLQNSQAQLHIECQTKQEQLSQEQQEQRKLEGDYTKRMQQLSLEKKEARDEIQKYTESKDQISRASDKLQRGALMEMVQAQAEQKVAQLELDSTKMTIGNGKSNMDKKFDKIISETDATFSYIPSRISKATEEFDRLFPLDFDLP